MGDVRVRARRLGTAGGASGAPWVPRRAWNWARRKSISCCVKPADSDPRPAPPHPTPPHPTPNHRPPGPTQPRSPSECPHQAWPLERRAHTHTAPPSSSPAGPTTRCGRGDAGPSDLGGGGTRVDEAVEAAVLALVAGVRPEVSVPPLPAATAPRVVRGAAPSPPPSAGGRRASRAPAAPRRGGHTQTPTDIRQRSGPLIRRVKALAACKRDQHLEGSLVRLTCTQ